MHIEISREHLVFNKLKFVKKSGIRTKRLLLHKEAYFFVCH